MLISIYGFSQSESKEVSITLSRNIVRFALPDNSRAHRIEVSNASGDMVYDSGTVKAQIVDWLKNDLTGEPAAEGIYSYTITFIDESGSIQKQSGNIILGHKRESVASAGGLSATVKTQGVEDWDVDQGDNPYKIRTPRMGLGTQNPLARLHVGTGGAAPLTAGGTLMVQEEGGSSIVVKSASGGEALIFQDNINGLFGTVSNHPLGIRTGNKNRLWITSEGLTGIGTSNPNSFLEVAGLIHSTTGGIKFPDGSIQTTAAIGDTDGSVTGVVASTGLDGGGTGGMVKLGIAEQGVETFMVADSAMTAAKIAPQAVRGQHIGAQAVAGTHIAPQAVASAHLAPAAVAGQHIAENSVGSQHIGGGAVKGMHLAENSVGPTHIAGEIPADKLADSTVTDKKLALKAVTREKLDDKAVTEEKLDNSAVTVDKLADEAVTVRKIAPKSITDEKLDDNAVTVTKLADEAVTVRKLGAKAVTSDKIADKTIRKEQIADKTISREQIADGAIHGEHLGALSIGTPQIDNLAVTAEKLAPQSVSGSKLTVPLLLSAQSVGAVLTIDNSGTGIRTRSTGLHGIVGETTSDVGTGVAGTANNGHGVVGESTNGIGVFGSTINGFAVRANGNVIQYREKGGWVKAMFRYEASGPSCFQATEFTFAAAVNTCNGFTRAVGPGGPGESIITFPFPVNDRFVVVTPQSSGNFGISATIEFLAPNQIKVRTWSIGATPSAGWALVDSAFTLVVF